MLEQTDLAVVTVNSKADITTIAEIGCNLRNAMMAHPSVVVVLNAASEFDLSFIQLLEAARMHAAATSKTLSLSSPAGGELREQLARGGFLSRTSDREFWLQSGEVA